MCSRRAWLAGRAVSVRLTSSVSGTVSRCERSGETRGDSGKISAAAAFPVGLSIGHVDWVAVHSAR